MPAARSVPRGILWIIFAIALLFRGGWVTYGWISHGPALKYPDEALHWQLATNLVRDGALVSDDGRYAARMPVYPLFLAPSAALGDTGVLLARAMQAIIGALSAVGAGLLAGRLFGTRAAIAAGLLVACDPFAIFFANLLLTESLFTAMYVALPLAALVMIEHPRWAAAAALAVVGAAQVMTRPSSLLLLPAVWLVVCLATPRHSRVRVLGLLALAPLALVVALVPWGLRNQAVIGDPAWLSTNGGVTLYDAQGPQADGSSEQGFLRRMPDLSALGEAERDARLRTLAVEQMRSDPQRVLELAAIKLARTWNPFPNVEEYRRGAAAWVGGAYSGAIYGLAIAGIIMYLARRPWFAWAVLLGPVLYLALIHAVYIGSLRYRLPAMPLLAVVGAAVFQPPTGLRWRPEENS